MQKLFRLLLKNHVIARPFGIEVGVHGTLIAVGLFWILSAFATSFGSGVFQLISLVVLFGSVAVHELGHALAARYYRIPTRTITLTPIGGIAMLGGQPRNATQELVITAAGPLVNVVIAGFVAPIYFVLGGLLATMPIVGTSVTLGLGLALWVNVMLFVFNLIPAFPMDGGRFLRALLEKRIGRLRATRIAAKLGTGLAVVLGIVGVFTGRGTLTLIALFVYFAASQELKAVEREAGAQAVATNPLEAILRGRAGVKWPSQTPWTAEAPHASPRRARTELDLDPGSFRVLP